MQACSVVTVQDIRDAGALLWANGLAGAIERRFFDGNGPAAVPVMTGSLPFMLNSCHYILEPDADRGGVHIEVHQPTYADQNAIAGQPRFGYQPLPPIDGVAVHRNTRPQPHRMTSWLLHTGDTLVELSVDHPEQRTKNAILATAARRLVKQIQHSTGPPRFSYDSPAFGVEYANACKLFGNTEFRTVFQADAQAVAVEWLATAIGVINYGLTVGPDRDFNHVQHVCARTSPGEDRRRQQNLTVEIQSFETDEPARLDFARLRQRPNQAPMPTAIGDETVFCDMPGRENVLSFRHGRFLVHLSYSDPARRDIPDREQVSTLTPVAQTIADRIARL